MKIGIDARMYRSSVAGIGRYSQNLIKNLLELDLENEYILFMTSEDKKEFENWAIENSLKIKNLKLKIIVTDIPHYSIGEQIKFAKIIEKERLDLMHFLHFNVPVRYKGKFIVTIHDLTLLFYPQAAKDINFLKHLGFRWVIKKAVLNAQKIIAVSENTKKDIIKKFQIPESRIQVIYEAADDKIFKEINSDLSNKLRTQYAIGNKPVILYVGQFRGHKNIASLVKAFTKLRKEIPCQLVLLGSGPKIDNPDIIMPGYVSDEELAAWYKLADVFAMPSLYEGFGLPGLEAMTAGVPVVASNRASLPEVYQDAACYFNPFSFQDISDKIKMVLQDKKLRQKLIENGRKVSGQYSWRKTAEETLTVYKQISK